MTPAEIESALDRLALLDEACGVGLWSAVLPEGRADHPDAQYQWSPEFRRLLGYQSVADFPNLGSSWTDRMHPDDAGPTFAAFNAQVADLSGRTPYDVTYRLKCRDGEYRWFRATGGCRHLDGGLVRACGSLSDVHEVLTIKQAIETEAQADTEALVRISRTVGDLSRGDMRARIDAALPQKMAALKADINAMADSLNAAIAQIKGASLQMTAESQQIATGSRDLAGRAERQAAAVEETAAAIEEISGNVSTTSSAAKHADQVAAKARDHTRRGTDIVREVIAAMEAIEGHTRKMSEITRVIESFAFQTNLLSINAAVEAARAGEVGRGFAVVAAEVRNLAQQSAKASQNIGELIERSESDVRRGVSLVREAGAALDEINASVATMVDGISGIAHATAEQSIGVSEISSSLSEIDRITQANVSLAENQASSAAALNQQLDEMSALIGSFVTGTESAAAPAIRRAA